MACRCKEKNKRENWRIMQYRCNHSAFNGYRRTPSNYSSLQCLICTRVWRTKAEYVDEIYLKHGANR